jgi:GMP synthase (glutamine-hydrolysing)
MRVLVVDNGGQWTHREWRVLKYLDCDAAIIPNTTPAEKIDADALVLSGGAVSIASKEDVAKRAGMCQHYLDDLHLPILGICAGHQIIALHFGGSIGSAQLPEYGTAEIEVDYPGVLFQGVPKKFTAWESHNDEVKTAPGFRMTAHSANCKVQAIEHESRPIFGVQFHPEVEHTQHGYDIFKNFLKTVKK